jgi:hypothetical protein
MPEAKPGLTVDHGLEAKPPSPGRTRGSWLIPTSLVSKSPWHLRAQAVSWNLWFCSQLTKLYGFPANQSSEDLRETGSQEGRLWEDSRRSQACLGLPHSFCLQSC